MLGGVDGSIGERDIEAVLSERKVVDFSEILVDEGNGGARVDHSVDWERGTVEVEGDWNSDGTGSVILSNRREVVKRA